MAAKKDSPIALERTSRIGFMIWVPRLWFVLLSRRPECSLPEICITFPRLSATRS
jgi:hypothetical protein